MIQNVMQNVAKHWWVLLVRGIVALALGIYALVEPGLTVYALTILFAAYALVDGIAAIVAAVRMSGKGSPNWGWLLAGGIVGALFGVAALIFPGIALFYLVILIAAWAIVTGIAEIVTAWRLRETIKGEWLWILAGVLSIVFGIVVCFEPATGVFFLIYMFSFYMILAGVSFIGLSLRLRRRMTPAVAP
jgi:uncharacterized membrane protein HdeD (DUF308 family)